MFSKLFKLNPKRQVIYNDQEFNNKNFGELILGGVPNKIQVIQNVKFKNCSGGARSFIFTAAELENVLFENFHCSNSFRIDAEVVLANVKFVGKKKPTSLWIRPTSNEQFDHDDYSLDISEFDGYVDIVGVNIKKVKTNRETQIKIDLDDFYKISLKEVFPDRLNYWRVIMSKIEQCKARQGVFSIPIDKEGHEMYQHGLKLFNERGFSSNF